ncbi:hypothetical protein NKJ26_05940 [Mesorhizobium sp. M0152]|uniref:hypothetical protein n=1 Tax=Mesorhizobium sp. M0152 TaxID=2956898 RepID=UPI00333E127A
MSHFSQVPFRTMETSLPADITWTNGRNSFPLGTIRHTWTDDDREAGLEDGSGLCRIWMGRSMP